MNHADALRSRWKPSWNEKYPDRKAAFDSALLLHQAAAYQLEQIRKASNGNLTEKGLREQLRAKLGTSSCIGRLKQDKLRIAEARQALAQRRTSLGEFTYDKADIIGALHRREYRERIINLSRGEQTSLLMNSAAARQAVYEMPAEFSGLDETEYARWRDHHVRTTHAPTLAALDEQADVLDHVEQALDLAIGTAKTESGLNEAQAVAWVASIAP